MNNEKLSWPICERKDCFEPWNTDTNTAQKVRFSSKDSFSKCDQIRRKLRIWLHLLKKSLMENFFFVYCTTFEEHFH